MEKKKSRSTAKKVHFSDERVGELIGHARIETVHLVSTDLRCQALSQAESDDALILRCPPAQFTAFVDAENKKMYCGVRFEAALAADAEGAPAMEIKAEYAILYDVSALAEVDVGVARSFASRNAVHNAWPFFRELVHSLSSRTGFGALVVPLLRLPPNAEPHSTKRA